MSNAPKKAYTDNQLQDLRNKNATRAQVLAQEGRMLHPLSIIQCHLTALIEGLGFDYKLEEELSKALDQAEEEQRRAKLLEGLSLPTFGKDSQ